MWGAVLARSGLRRCRGWEEHNGGLVIGTAGSIHLEHSGLGRVECRAEGESNPSIRLCLERVVIEIVGGG